MRAIRQALHRASALLPARPGSGLLVLTYHLVGAGSASPVDLDPGAFRDQLVELRRCARPVGLEEALRALREPDDDLQSGGAPRVLITFDDAYANFHTHAFPVLQELAFPAVLYVPVGFVEGTSPAPIRGTDGLGACSWSQLGEVASSGLVAIGSHTLTHRDLPSLPAHELVSELRDSRARLEERLRVPVESFCYPRGGWCAGAEPLVQATYRSAVVRGGRRNPCGGKTSPWRLERVPLRRDMPEDIRAVLEARVWLEEWVVTRVKPWLA